MTTRRTSQKASRFTESVIREMTRLADRHGAINLAQGFPDFAAPSWLKDAASHAVQNDINQYAVTWGAPELRSAIAWKYEKHYGWPVDPDLEITVGCGSTECMIATLLALVDPGEKVLVLEPFYENYGPDSIIAGASPVYAALDADRDWTLDLERLESTIQKNLPQGGIRALILNTPHNPTGKVFSREELRGLAELVERYDFFVITDEIYEHIVYDGLDHTLFAQLPGMRERTVTISGLSKTYSVTGWRIGYILAPQDLTSAIRKIHDFLTVGAPAPLQHAGSKALRIEADYYTQLARGYSRRRDFFVEVLRRKGFRFTVPSGAYYIMVDISQLTEMDDLHFVQHLIRECGVAAVPGSSFFERPENGRHLVRFAYCKSLGLLEQAAERLEKLAL
jgi:aminotransferase